MRTVAPLPPVVFAAIVAIGAAIAFVLHRISADVAAITVLLGSMAIAKATAWTMRVDPARKSPASRTTSRSRSFNSIRNATSVLAAFCCWFDSLNTEEASSEEMRPKESNAHGEPCAALCWAIEDRQLHSCTTFRSLPRLHQVRCCAKSVVRSKEKCTWRSSEPVMHLSVTTPSITA